MIRKSVFIFIIIICITIGQFVYYSNKTEKVFVSGKVFGFDIQNINNDEYTEYGDTVATSLKKIGIVTFIKKEGNYFAALGHPVSELKNKKIVSGGCYDVDLEEIEKGKKNEPGRIVAILNEKRKLGEYNSINSYGMFGKMHQRDENVIEMETSSRYNISRGKAEILLNIKGIKKYEIEITKINYFNKNKNLKFKVTSEELISNTGGVIQGMSGAPIVQNGRLIGAVNFVSTVYPTEAYGIFIDKLI